MSRYVPITLQDKLIHDSREQQIGPAPYHNRTGQMLAEQQNEMQSELDSLNEYCRLSKMSINQKKSKCMLFNRARKHDFMPELYLNRGRKLEVVEEMKLVGYKLRTDLRTISNTNYIVARAWKRMWIVRRLKALGASEQDLLKVLRAQVLSVLQFASPAWSTLITAHESARIESVLKTGLFLVYGHRYESFSWALREANWSSLEDQRTRYFEKFTQNCLKNKKFQNWFVRMEDSTEGVVTRRRKARFKPVPTRTASYARSAIPQIVKVANNQHKSDSQIKITLNSGQILVF